MQLPEGLSNAGDAYEDILNDAGDVCEDVVDPPCPVVLGPADSTRTMTNDEIYLALLHSEVKSRAIVPLNPKFNALPRQEYRLFKLCLPDGFKPSALAFFKLFFTDWVFDILVQNTNLNAYAKNARTVHNGIKDSKGRLWNPVNKHELSI
jgi:hypothetical protein